MPIDDLKEVSGMFSLVDRAMPDPLDRQRKQLGIMQQMRALSEPTEREKLARKEKLDVFKYTLDKYSKMIEDHGTSPAARGVMKELLSGYVAGAPEDWRMAAGPALAYSPISPNRMKIDEIRKMFPVPGRPEGGRSAENRLENAKVDWAATQQEFMVAQTMGLEFQTPKLLPTDDPNIFSYKDPMTKQIGLFDMNGLPRDMLKMALDEYGASIPGIAQTGIVPMAKPGVMTFGDAKYTVYHGMDVKTGETVTQRIPLGKSDKEPGKIDSAVADMLGVVNGYGKEGDLQVRMQIFPSMLKEAEKEFEKTGESQTLAEVNNRLLGMGMKHVIAPNERRIRESWWNWIPGKDSIVFEDGAWMALPVDGTTRLSVNGGEMMTFYNVRDKDGNSIAVDAKGNPIPESRGVEDGGNIRVEEGAEPSREVTGLQEEIEQSTKALGNALEKKGVTVGDVLVGMVDSLENWPESQVKGPGKEELKKRLRKELLLYDPSEAIRADDFVKMVWDGVFGGDLPTRRDELTILAKLIWRIQEGMWKKVSAPVGKAFEWLFELELEGEDDD